MAKPLAVVKSLDHLVLTCASIARTSQWYSKHLGMKAQTFTPTDPPSSAPRTALVYGTQKINLHQEGSEFEPKAMVARPGTADLCFLIDDGISLEDVLGAFQKDGVSVLEGGKIVNRTGACGPIRSLYVRDPDGNLIELSKYQAKK